MEIKKIDASGVAFLIKEEALRLRAYLDSKGIWTIGIGCTYYPDERKVKKGDRITRLQAIEMFMQIVKHFEMTVYSTTRDDLNQNQFNALVSLCYNIGPEGFKTSTVRRLVNINPYSPLITTAFEMWRNAGAKKGILLKRRQREAALYFKQKKGSNG